MRCPCGKIRYDDPGTAHAVIRAMRHKSKFSHRYGKRRKKVPAHAYLCKVCFGWHLTSGPLLP